MQLRSSKLIILLLLSIVIRGRAQTYPVQATLNITPPYSVYLNDYTRTGSTMFATTFTFMDMTKPSVNVRFRIVIEGVGIEIRTKESYLGKLYVLPSGIPELFYGDQLAEYFSAENLDFKGISKEEIIKNGALPEGVYRFTIEVLEYNRGVKISNSASSVAWLVLNDPPLLNMPDNNQEIITIDPQVVRFQWTPRHKGSPNSSFSTVYKLKIVEIWPDNRNPNDAINSMNPVFETTTANHYYVYSIVDPPLIAGRMYAYQVQAIPNSTLEQLDLFKNNGYSEVRAFRFGKICEPPLDINLLSAHNKSLDLYWQPPVNATAFTVHYRPSGKESNWYQKFTYLPDLTLNDLVPDENYDIKVESHCDVQLSELSDTEVYKTTDTQNDFVCGPIEFTPNLENTTPLDYVFPGDYIEAGDFKIELVRVSKSAGGFSGYGIAEFPFLNQLTSYVKFENIKINTDKIVYQGSLTTFYNANKSFFNEGNSQLDSITDSVVLSDSIPANPGDTTLISDSFTLVDTVFSDEAGQIIVIIDGEEVPLSEEELADSNGFQDADGNTYTVSDDGIVVNKNNPETTPTEGSGPSTFASGSTKEFDFGILKIKIKEDSEPEEKNGTCLYNKLNVSISLALQDDEKNLEHQVELSSAVFSYSKDCLSDEFLVGSISWDNSNSEKSINIAGLQLDLQALAIEVDKDGIKTGSLEFSAGLSQDLALNEIMVLRSGVNGDVSFEINREETGLGASFDFSGLSNINIDLQKQQKVLARIQDAAIDPDGLINGKFLLSENIEFSTNNFTVIVNKLNLDIKYLLGRIPQIVDGQVELLVKNMAGLQGQIKVAANYQNDLVQTKIVGKKLTTFGMELSSVNLKVNLDDQLNFTIIEGSLEASHPSFGVALDVDHFTIENGELSRFNFSGQIANEGVDITIQNAEFVSSDNHLLLEAFAEVEQEGIYIAAEIEDFKILADGTIEWGTYNLNFDGRKTLGPLTVAIKGATGESSGTWRKTTAEASLRLELNGLEEPISVTGATIEYEKHRNKDRYRNLAIKLDEGNLKTKLGALQMRLSSMNITVQTSENYIAGDGSNAESVKISENSFLSFNLDVVKDIELGKLLYLGEGLEGSLTYSFNGQGIGGSLLFDELSNLNIELRKGEFVLAKLNDSEISTDGVLTGRVSAIEGAKLSVNGFGMEVQQMAYDVVFPLKNDLTSFQVLAGGGTLQIQNSKGLEGELLLAYELDPEGNIVANISGASDINAFGMILSDLELGVDLDNDLNLTRIYGNVNAKHAHFTTAVAVENFLLEYGELKSFSLQGEVNVDGFDFKLEKAEFQDEVLDITGEVAVSISGSSAWLAVEQLTIDRDGTLSIRGISGELDKKPVYIAFSANMEESRFQGTFTGKLSDIGLSGELDIGVSDDSYQFAYLKLAAQGNIPLVGTGLKLTEFGGHLGYNYKLVYEKADAPPEGSPQEGNYVVGLILGVADMANLVEVKGNAVAQFGNDKFDLNLLGSITVPKENHIFKGDANVHYSMPANTLDGNVSLALAVPPSTGKVLSGDFDMDYAYAKSKWAVSSTNFSANLFDEIEFTGNLDLYGAENDPVQGVLSGQANYEFDYSRDFSALGTDFKAKVKAGFSFEGDIELDELGASGQVYLLVYANGELGIVSDIGEYQTLLAISGSSEALLEFNNDSALVAGKMQMAIKVLGFEKDIDFAIEQQI